MSWSNAFLQSLDHQAYKPIFQLRFINLGNQIGSTFVLYSTGNAPLKIGRSGITIGGTRVIPGRWAVSFGGFTCEVVGNMRELYACTRKGSFAELLCSIQGLPYERVAIGQLQSITRQGFSELYSLQFRDLISAFQNTCNSSVGAIPSPSASNPTQQPMFWRSGIKTPLTSLWSIGDATMSVTDASDFEKETGANGIIKCINQAYPDKPFFIEIASINTGANTFDTSPYSGAVVYPSINVNSALPVTGAGSTAYTCVRLNGHPSDILGKIITSTGTGNNGALDTMPASWGVGGQFNANVFDKADADLQKKVLRGSAASAYSWRIVHADPVADGLRGFMNSAAQCGMWAVLRQGSISWRGCTDPEGQGMTYAPIVADKIFDYDIMEFRSHEIYSGNQSSTYVISTQQYTTALPVVEPYTDLNSLGQVGGRTLSLPSQREILRSAVFIYNPTESRADLALGDSNRMSNWDHWTWEKLTLVLSMRKSHLVAGDIVEITSRYIYGLQEGAGQTYYGKRAMVIGSGFDLVKRQCIIEFAVISGRNS